MSKQPVIILVRPQLGENIGAAARAMLNFGLRNLRLVEPRDGWPSLPAERNSAGALDIMPPVEVYDTLDQALADIHYSFATTARGRELNKEVSTPKSAAKHALKRSEKDQRTAFVFGAERTGLTNEECALCHEFLTIPANPDFSSLNLAQAVLLISAVWQEAAADYVGPRDETIDGKSASHGDVLNYIHRLEIALDERGFFKSEDLKPTMRRNIKTMLLRAKMSEQEINTLHGMLSSLIGQK